MKKINLLKIWPIFSYTKCERNEIVARRRLKKVITHSKWEAYMDLVENSGGGGRRQEIEQPQGM